MATEPAPPRITVLMPVRDAAAFVGGAVDSVLSQSFRDFELLVLDDGSSDGSGAVAAGTGDARIRVVRSDSPQGLVATLNRGLLEARGRYVARQDADDVSAPRRLERQVERLDADPGLALIGGQGRLVDSRDRYLRDLTLPVEHASLRWSLLFDNPFLHSAATFRLDVVRDELGGYGDRRYCEDFDLWSRLAARYRVANLPDRVLVRRAHGASVLRTPDPERLAASTAGNRDIVSANLAALFGEGSWAAADVARLASLRTGVPPHGFVAFADAFERLRAGFETLFPQTRRSADFRRTLARQWVQAGYGLAGRRPDLALRATLRACALAPAVPLSLIVQALRRVASRGRLPPRQAV